jgi:Tfp pilus assembly protein PilO
VNPRFLPWLKTWWAWIPPLALLLASIAMLLWQTSDSLGRRGTIAAQTETLNARLQQLEVMASGAATERSEVARTTDQLDQIFDDVFGRYELRVTQVLREIDAAVRGTGMVSDGYSYGVEALGDADGSRLSIRFRVEGRYDQVVRMLDTIQASPQFLVVEQVAFKGEQEALTRALNINLKVSTVFSDAEPGQLEELAARLELEGAAEVPE